MAKTVPPKTARFFNLLKPYKPPVTGWDRIYDWLIGKARVVMVVAEIVVAVTFVGKVVADTQAKNIEDDIEIRDFELSQLAVSIEPTLRKLQLKTQMYQQLWDGSTSYAAILQEVNNYIPNPGSELVISVAGDEVIVSGEDSFSALEQIEQAMKQSPTFSTVSVTQLNTDTAGVDGVGGDYVLVAKVAKLDNRPKIIPDSFSDQITP